MTLKNIKKTARSGLNQNWGKTLVVFSIPIMVFIMIAAGEFLFRAYAGIPIIENSRYNVSEKSLIVILFGSVLWVMLIIPLKLSAKGYYYNLVSKEKVYIGSVFDAFSSPGGYISSLILPAKLNLRRLFFMIILFAPPVLLGLAAYCFFPNPWFEFSLGLSSVLILTGLWAFISINLSCFLAPYLLISNQACSAKEAIKKSKILMKGNKMKLIGLYFSMIGWMILCLPLVSAVFAIPEINTRKAVFAKAVISRL